MKKNKFVLTSDLVDVSPEEIKIDEKSKEKVSKSEVVSEKEQLNIRISKELKRKLQIWCIENNRSMADIVEELINDKLL